MFKSQNRGYQNVLSTNGLFINSHTPPNEKEYEPFEFGRNNIFPSLGDNSR